MIMICADNGCKDAQESFVAKVNCQSPRVCIWHCFFSI